MASMQIGKFAVGGLVLIEVLPVAAVVVGGVYVVYRFWPTISAFFKVGGTAIDTVNGVSNAVVSGLGIYSSASVQSALQAASDNIILHPYDFFSYLMYSNDQLVALYNSDPTNQIFNPNY